MYQLGADERTGRLHGRGGWFECWREVPVKQLSTPCDDARPASAQSTLSRRSSAKSTDSTATATDGATTFEAAATLLGVPAVPTASTTSTTSSLLAVEAVATVPTVSTVPNVISGLSVSEQPPRAQSAPPQATTSSPARPPRPHRPPPADMADTATAATATTSIAAPIQSLSLAAASAEARGARGGAAEGMDVDGAAQVVRRASVGLEMDGVESDGSGAENVVFGAAGFASRRNAKCRRLHGVSANRQDTNCHERHNENATSPDALGTLAALPSPVLFQIFDHLPGSFSYFSYSSYFSYLIHFRIRFHMLNNSSFTILAAYVHYLILSAALSLVNSSNQSIGSSIDESTILMLMPAKIC